MDRQSGKTIATDGDVKHWMTALHPVVGTLKLHELKIPSTQHSGLIECDGQQDESNGSDSTGSPWGFQIEAGIRALDLRIYQHEEGHWVFHYNNLPSLHSVQSLIDWCNAYYSAPEPIINNEIIVLHVHDCFSPMDQFNDSQLRDLFVNGLRSTSLIPRRAALLNLMQIHQDYPGKNIVLSWDRCVDDDLIWPYRWQGWVKTDVPAGKEQKPTLPLRLICNAVTECISTLVVANTSSPAMSAGQPSVCSELDHGLIERCISYNVDAAPFLSPDIEDSYYNYRSEKFYLIVRPDLRAVQYQVDLLGGGFVVYPYTLSNGYYHIEVPLKRQNVGSLIIRSLDARGKISQHTLVGFNSSAPAPVLALGDSSASVMPDSIYTYRTVVNNFIIGSVTWDLHEASIFEHVVVKVYRLSTEGKDTGPALIEKTVPNTASATSFNPVPTGYWYLVVLVGVYPGGRQSKPAWRFF